MRFKLLKDHTILWNWEQGEDMHISDLQMKSVRISHQWAVMLMTYN